MDQHEEIPFELLARYFEGKYSKKELEELESWKAKSELNRKEFRLAKKIYASDMDNSFKPNMEKALRKVLNRLPDQKKPATLRSMKWLGVAASLIIGVGIAFIGLRYLSQHEKKLLSYHNEKYDKVVVTLPDDSNIWLRKGSELHFPVDFKGKKRKVKFSGEGYFEIADDPSHPFEIEAGNTITQVLGTKFLLNTKSVDSSIVLVLDEGLVSFKTKSTKSIEIEAGEKLVFYQEIRFIKISKNEELNHASWKSRNLRFRNESLENIIQDIENFYEIQFETIPNEISLEEHSFTLDSLHSIDEAIEILENVLELNIAKEGDFYYIEGNS